MEHKTVRLLFFRCVTTALLLGLWQFATLFFPPLVVPPISNVAARLYQIVTGEHFLSLVGTTLLRLLAGLGLGVALGAGIGLLFGLCKPLEDVFAPLVTILQTVPPVCWVVLALVWFGFNGKPCVFIVATVTIPTVVINLSSGVRSIDPELIEMARMYHFSKGKMIRHVILPSVQPYFRSALEIVAGGGWKLVVMGEVLTTSTGIGGAITTARLNIEPDSIIAWALLLVFFFTGILLFSDANTAQDGVLPKGGRSLLTLSNINQSFGALPVLKDFSLSVQSGEIVALIGPSGCGKTTLLNIISGLETPNSGTVKRQYVRLSYLFQSTRLLPWRTVYDNIRLVRENAPHAEIQKLIEAVGLAGFERYYPGQLSGGMAKRCALARAFHYGGDLLLMDEPFQGLDYGLRMEMLSMLLSIWRSGRQGILFVTHEIDEALTAATRIVVLRSRPATVCEVIPLPGQEGRDATAPELDPIRRHIIHSMMEGAT